MTLLQTSYTLDEQSSQIFSVINLPSTRHLRGSGVPKLRARISYTPGEEEQIQTYELDASTK